MYLSPLSPASRELSPTESLSAKPRPLGEVAAEGWRRGRSMIKFPINYITSTLPLFPPSHPLRGSWICKANSKNTACGIPLSPPESLGVTAFFYCLISLRENFRFCVSKTGDFITWGNFRERVQLWFRVIALLYAPSNLVRLITVLRKNWCFI